MLPGTHWASAPRHPRGSPLTAPCHLLHHGGTWRSSLSSTRHANGDLLLPPPQAGSGPGSGWPRGKLAFPQAPVPSRGSRHGLLGLLGHSAEKRNETMIKWKQSQGRHLSAQPHPEAEPAWCRTSTGQTTRATFSGVGEKQTVTHGGVWGPGTPGCEPTSPYSPISVAGLGCASPAQLTCAGNIAVASPGVLRQSGQRLLCQPLARMLLPAEQTPRVSCPRPGGGGIWLPLAGLPWAWQ